MSVLLIGTRKGLFSVGRKHEGWEVLNVSFLGDPVTMVHADTKAGTWYAALKHGHFGVKLHRSDDAGRSWHECSAPSYGHWKDKEGNEQNVSDVWALEADGRGGLWLGTIPGGLFHSPDGQAWTLNHALESHPLREKWMGGGADKPGLHSICVHPDNPDDIVLGVSVGGVWHSTDGGKSWDCTAKGLRAEYVPPDRTADPTYQDPHMVRQCPCEPMTLWMQHHNGIFLSRDRGHTWSEKTIGPSQFGFGVVVHPKEPETAWFVPGIKDEQRYPVDARLTVTVTNDGGETSRDLSDGLPQSHAYDVIYRHAFDGRDGTLLAMGSTTGNVWISENAGERWTQFSAHLPPVYCVRFV